MPISVNGANGITFADGSIQNTGAAGFGFKNRIINGDMRIDQRNAGAALTGISSSVYCLDRWKFDIGGTGTFTLQQSSTAPTGFSNSLAITCTAAAASPAVLYAEQKIEGFNLQDLAYNTASASSVTMSFWVRSNKTGTFVALLYNTSTTRMVGRTYTISTANTWEQKTVTFPGDTAAAIPNSNANGLEIRFWLAAGSTWSSGTLPTTWATDVTANQAAGQTVNLADTIGNILYITGVQLEKGSTATAFDYRDFGRELALCQRYYEKSYDYGTAPGTSNALQQAIGLGIYTNTPAAYNRFGHVYFKVAKRAGPTVTLYAPATGSSATASNATSGDGGTNIGYSQAAQVNQYGFNIAASVGGSTNTNYYTAFFAFTADSEL
jgi:hypothetical protein